MTTTAEQVAIAIFGLFDPDYDRRRQAISTVAASLASRTQTKTQRFDHASGIVLACASPVVPLDHATGPQGWSLVWGKIADAPRPALWAFDHAAQHGPNAVNGHGGIYVTCLVDGAGVVTLASDTLGFCPVYYWSDDEVFIFASEPLLIHAHPRVERRLSLAGLAGILLQGHMANGQTIWRGIRRPDPGHAVRWERGKGSTCLPANPLSPTDEYFRLEYENARHRMAETLAASIRRSVPEGNVSLMLSGGLDSRLVAGYLDRIAPRRTTAYVFGDPKDIEVECATAVRKALRMKEVRATLHYERYSSLAAQFIRQEQLSNSLVDFAWPSGFGDAAFVSPYLMSGLHGDAVIGGTTIPWALDPRTGEFGFDRLLESVTAWGFKPDDVANLMAVDSARRIVDDVIEEMRARYDAMLGSPFQKTWLWTLQNRVRFHTFPYAWRMASHVWPLTPYGDREMLGLASALPLNYVRDRRMQLDTLNLEFPLLARQPLDRNSWDSSPVVPTMASRVRSKARQFSRRLHPSGPDRRLYFRQYDINNPGWRSIRQAADLHRADATSILRPEALGRLLPSPEATISAPSGIRDTAGSKTLCALLMLLGGAQHA